MDARYFLRLITAVPAHHVVTEMQLRRPFFAKFKNICYNNNTLSFCLLMIYFFNIVHALEVISDSLLSY